MLRFPPRWFVAGRAQGYVAPMIKFHEILWRCKRGSVNVGDYRTGVKKILLRLFTERSKYYGQKPAPVMPEDRNPLGTSSSSRGDPGAIPRPSGGRHTNSRSKYCARSSPA